MLFNTNSFFVFFFGIITIYFATPPKYRNVLLLLASYYFYMCWKTEYIILIMISTLVDYYCGLRMGELIDRAQRKKYLFISVFTNLSILFAFKYFNFISNSFGTAVNFLGLDFNAPLLNVLLPVGISFYTFQTLSYSIDVYYGHMKPEKRILNFALYVSFFPQLVAGPIERAKRLLPQFEHNYKFEYERVKNGLVLVLWGMFKKVVIADRVAEYVNTVYATPEIYKGFTIWIANFFFYVQIYCDFSGYSDIAIGTAAILGYKLMLNFRQPMLSQDVQDYWSRWHISLTTWFRDYFYKELGGKKKGLLRWYLNLIILFTAVGTWHGANWTFVLFGLVQGVLVVTTIIGRPYFIIFKKSIGLYGTTFNQIVNIIFNIAIISSTTILFRSARIDDVFVIIPNAFDFSEGLTTKLNLFHFQSDMVVSIIVISLLLFVDILSERKKLTSTLIQSPQILKWSVFIIGIVSLALLGRYNQEDFIYFQF